MGAAARVASRRGHTRQVVPGVMARYATVPGHRVRADPGLRARLGQVSVPTLVVWGDSDRMPDPYHG
jgi:pimeloyl-ACP methyl ester carboxylesterase